MWEGGYPAIYPDFAEPGSTPPKFSSRRNPRDASRRSLHPHIGVIPSAAVLQAEREPAVSEAEGDLSRTLSIRFARVLEFAAEEKCR
jgi:hypothetical protein